MHFNLKTLHVVVPVVFLLACGKQEASRDDVRSELVTSLSMAAEAETFVGYVGQGRSTYDFASGHLDYLLGEVNRSAAAVSNLKASPDLAHALNVDRVQLRLLAVQIENVRRHLRQPGVLVATERQIRDIRMKLARANASL
ncbi:MAG: hypothetical protein ACRD1M_01805 [Terriglobales bacterium]